MRQVGLRRVTLNDVEMHRIFLDPVNLNLGEQVLVNNRFASMTIGSELVTNGDFSSATGWNLGSGWSIDTVLGTMTHDGTAKSNTTQTGFTAYQAIKTEIITDSNDQTSNKALVRETFLQNKWTLSNNASAIDVNWECNAGTEPTIFSIRDTEENTTSRVFSSISIKPVTLDSWSEIGTRTATEHLCYDGDQALVNIFSGGAQIGITQDLSDGDTYGSELQPNSDLSGTAGGHDGTGSGSGAVADDYTIYSNVGDVYTSSKDGNDHQVITATSGDNVLIRATANRPTLSSGTLYKASITLSDLTGSVDWLVRASFGVNVQFQNTITSAGTYTLYFIADASFSASVYLLLLDAGESCTISEMSIKEVTTVNPVFEPGGYYYSIGIENDNAGSLKLSTPTDGDLAVIDNTGPHTGVISLTDPNIQLEANGACDVTPSYFNLYPVI